MDPATGVIRASTPSLQYAITLFFLVIRARDSSNAPVTPPSPGTPPLPISWRHLSHLLTQHGNTVSGCQFQIMIIHTGLERPFVYVSFRLDFRRFPAPNALPFVLQWCVSEGDGRRRGQFAIIITIAFITFNSSLVPLFEGL